LEDGFGAGKAPAIAGDVEAVGDQVAAASPAAPVVIGQSAAGVRCRVLPGGRLLVVSFPA